MDEEGQKSKEGVCHYHLCRKETIVYRCEYCGNYFCKEHLKPKLPMAAPFNSLDYDKMNIWREKSGHPCPGYVIHWEKEQKKKEEKYRQSLEKVLASPIKYSKHNRYHRDDASYVEKRYRYVNKKHIKHRIPKLFKNNKKGKVPLEISAAIAIIFLILVFLNVTIYGSHESFDGFDVSLKNMVGELENIVGEMVYNNDIESEPLSFDAMTMGSTSIKLRWVNEFQLPPSTGYAVFTRIQRKVDAYPSSIDDGTTVYNGTGNLTIDTGLSPGHVYYYRAWHYLKLIDCSKWSSRSAYIFNITKPEHPNSFVTKPYDETRVELFWKKGRGAQFTCIIRKMDAQPDNLTDGVLVYNGTGEHFIDSELATGERYFYRAWSVCERDGIRQYSVVSEKASAIPSYPTYNEIREFVAKDQTDKKTYIPGVYVCHNFSVDVIKNAYENNIHAGYVSLENNGTPIHAIVVFNTCDRGLIFLEPQMDVLFTRDKMNEMEEEGRYSISVTYPDGSEEYFDFEFTDYSINWNYLEEYG